MPRKKSTGDKPLPANKQKGKKVCTCCQKEKNMIDFYISYSPMYSLDNRIPVCKECCKTSVLNEDNTINYHKFKKLLMQIDKPLYYDLIDSAVTSVKNENGYLKDDAVKYRGKDILQKYFTLIAMRQDRKRCWVDAEKEGHLHQNNNRSITEKREIFKKYHVLFSDNTNFENDMVEKTIEKQKKVAKESIVTLNNNDFEVTPEIIDLFGEGYTPSMYKKMQEKYNKLKINYTLQTNIHQEALATYVRFKVQEELATAKGDVTEAKKWYDAAQSSAQDAKLTPKQLTKADLDSGVTSMSELTKALEQAVDVIKILPRFKYRPNDAVDFNIWCYVNYERRLNGKPEVPYEDVYKFYDEKKKQYIEQNGDPYGIFSNDTTEKNRNTVKTFIKLPDDYDDIGGENNENE